MAKSKGFISPKTIRQEIVDEIHGVKVPDPYRWLEDLTTDQTRAWVQEQNHCTREFFQKHVDSSPILEKLQDLMNYPRMTTPWRRGKNYFYYQNSGLQNQNILMCGLKPQEGGKVLLDPNLLSEDGTVALNGVSVSLDGKILAYGLSQKGSDWTEWRFRDVKSGRDYKDRLAWVKFCVPAWDKEGVYYSRYEEPARDQTFEQANYFQRLYYHKLGTEQSRDKLVYERVDQKEWGYHPRVSADGRYLILTVWRGTEPKNLLLIKDLKKKTPFREIVDQFQANFTYLGNEGDRFYIYTTFEAPRGRVMSFRLGDNVLHKWTEIIGETKATMQDVRIYGDRLIVHTLEDAHSHLLFFSLKGKLQGEINLPGIGTVTEMSGNFDSPLMYFGFSSFTNPLSIFQFDLNRLDLKLLRKARVKADLEQYETRQVFYTSQDGTKIPMFITARKGLELNGRNPVLLYGYGGFNISLTPVYSTANLTWLEMGGVYAQPNLRGGGEYGEKWHRAGTKHQKQNVFDDFIGAAEWLIENHYTSAGRIAIHGGSNGGLLVGACLLQRPELFGAASPSVGVLDMLRYHKFTIGWAWVDDYGSVDKLEEFKALLAYSPYHNVKSGVDYPPTLVMTGDHDDRVVPSHSYKFISRLQECNSGRHPVLIRIDVSAGHGAGKPTHKLLQEAADRLGFFAWALKMDQYLSKDPVLSVDSLDHLVLTVKDLEATISFYTRVMGMAKVSFGQGRTGLTFGSQRINLHTVDTDIALRPKKAAPGTADLCFLSSQGSSAWLAHLKAEGVEILEGPVNRVGAKSQILSLYFYDPDKNLIEIGLKD